MVIYYYIYRVIQNKESGTHCTGTLLSYNPIHDFPLNVSKHLLVLQNNYHSTDSYSMFFSQTPCYISRKAQWPFRNFPLGNYSFLLCRLFGRNGWSWPKSLTKPTPFDAHLSWKEKWVLSYITHFQFPNILLYFFSYCVFFHFQWNKMKKETHFSPTFLFDWLVWFCI